MSPSRIKVGTELQVCDLAIELQIIVLYQISDNTSSAALGRWGTYCSQNFGPDTRSKNQKLNQNGQKKYKDVNQRGLEMSSVHGVLDEQIVDVPRLSKSADF